VKTVTLVANTSRAKTEERGRRFKERGGEMGRTCDADDKSQKETIVSLGDTVPYPRAVVIKLLHTVVAIRAMLRPRGSIDVASIAEFISGHSCEGIPREHRLSGG
jgi:hypothetical protein